MFKMERELNILPELIPGLQSLHRQLEVAQAATEQHAPKIAPAEDAVSRLRARLAELDREAQEIAGHCIPVDEDRIAQLIAGAEVRSLDKKTIEANAAKESVIAAHRRQVTNDLERLEDHLAALKAKASALQETSAQAERNFLQTLADAILATYKHAAIEFIRRYMPPLHSIAMLLRQRIGEGPAWERRVFPGPSIMWLGEEMHPDTLRPGQMAYTHTQVWPRPDNCLLSGEPVISFGLIEDMVAAIKAHAGGVSHEA